MSHVLTYLIISLRQLCPFPGLCTEDLPGWNLDSFDGEIGGRFASSYRVHRPRQHWPARCVTSTCCSTNVRLRSYDCDPYMQGTHGHIMLPSPSTIFPRVGIPHSRSNQTLKLVHPGITLRHVVVVVRLVEKYLRPCYFHLRFCFPAVRRGMVRCSNSVTVQMLRPQNEMVRSSPEVVLTKDVDNDVSRVVFIVYLPPKLRRIYLTPNIEICIWEMHGQGRRSKRKGRSGDAYAVTRGFVKRF